MPIMPLFFDRIYRINRMRGAPVTITAAGLGRQPILLILLILSKTLRWRPQAALGGRPFPTATIPLHWQRSMSRRRPSGAHETGLKPLPAPRQNRKPFRSVTGLMATPDSDCSAAAGCMAPAARFPTGRPPYSPIIHDRRGKEPVRCHGPLGSGGWRRLRRCSLPRS